MIAADTDGILYGQTIRKHGLAAGSMEPTCLENGTIEYRRLGSLTRVELPAHTSYVIPDSREIESAEYDQILYMNSPEHELLHRVDGPAIETIGGDYQEWWLDGHRSRPAGGPTVIRADGSQMWIYQDKAYFTEEAWLKAQQGLIP